MEIVGVQGRAETITADIDWVINLTKPSKKSPTEFKSELVSQYLSDFRKTVSRKLHTVKSKDVDVHQIESVLNIEDTSVEENTESCNLENQNFIPVIEVKKSEIQNPFLELQKTVLVPDVPLTEHGIYLEDIKNSKLDREYTEEGIFLEDLQDEEPKEELQGYKAGVLESVEFIGHGVYLEDIAGNSESIDESLEEGDTEESSDNDIKYLGESSEDGLEYIDESYEEDLKEESSEDDLDYINESSEEDLEKGYIEEPITPIKERVQSKQEVNKTQTQPAKSIVSKRMPTQEISKESIPPTIREFVKLHKGCSRKDVLKFYSQKELQKALTTSKIYERHGKLTV